MLKEIELKEIMPGRQIYVIEDDKFFSLNVLLEGCRILVEDTEAPKPRGRKKSLIKNQKGIGEAEEKILKCYNSGEKTIKQIMEETGYSYPTVRKYIPINENG